MVKAKSKITRAGAQGANSSQARTLHWIGAEGAPVEAAQAAARALEGWNFRAQSAQSAQFPKSRAGDVLLLDAALSAPNAYELCRAWIGKTGCRTFVLTDADPKLAEGIAQFCGASGVLPRKLTAAALRRALGAPQPAPQLASSARSKTRKKPALPRSRMRDMSGAIDTALVASITDPESNLFNYAFLNYKLDEEFKRASRFGQPLSCVLVGLDGECETQTLRELAGIFLGASRDTDVLGRFDQTSFLFFLPATGPDGARIMAERVLAEVHKRRLLDVLGDELSLSVGIAATPHAKIRQREDLFAVAKRAFTLAQRKGGGVVVGT